MWFKGGWRDFTRPGYFSKSRAGEYFDSTNQNMCIDAEAYPGVFSDCELFIPTQDSKWTRTFLHVQILIPIFLRLLKKPIRSTFWRRIALHLRGFIKNEIDSRVPYNVRI